MITYDDVELLYAAYCHAQNAPANFDEAISDAYFYRTQATFKAWQDAREAYIRQVIGGRNASVTLSPLASHAQSTPSDTHTPTRDTAAPDMAGVADTQADAGAQSEDAQETPQMIMVLGRSVAPLPPPPVKEQPTDEQRAKAKAYADGLREQARLAQAQKQQEAENRARGAMALWDRS